MWVPATPGWAPLIVVVGGPSPTLAEGPRGCSPPFLAGACLWRWRGGVVCVCGCVVLLLVVRPLICGHSVCVCVECCLVLMWVVCGALVCLACACVFVCVRCVPSGVWNLGYVIPVLVRVAGRHGHDKRQKRRSC